MKSPLEETPKVLEKIGLFIVLFNLIDSNLTTEFVYLINQTNPQTRPILDFLNSQQISLKYKILEKFTGEKLCKEIEALNNFRNYLSHGSYGVNMATKKISTTKLNRAGKYENKTIDEKILDEYILRIREVLGEFHKLHLKRMGK